jgi:hypothetical protein
MLPTREAEDSQETRLPESQPNMLSSHLSNEGEGVQGANDDTSDDGTAIDETQGVCQHDTQVSSLAGTPQEQWHQHGNDWNHCHGPPSQVQVPQFRSGRHLTPRQELPGNSHPQRQNVAELFSPPTQFQSERRSSSSDMSLPLQRNHFHNSSSSSKNVDSRRSSSSNNVDMQRSSSYSSENVDSRRSSYVGNADYRRSSSSTSSTISRHNNNNEDGQLPLSNVTNTLELLSSAVDQSQNPSSLIPEWDGCTPDAILKQLKALQKDELAGFGMREFYKSYSSWEKMSIEQRNKMVSYFRTLPEELQGLYVVLFTFLLLFFFVTN